MFGKARETPQTEQTPFHPRSPYGVSKVAGFDLTRNYREAHGLMAVSGILFNHESPRRGFEFVTRKITRAAAHIKLGLEHELRLGNLDAQRDWGYAPDYVEGMWRMLQQDEPEDYVIATGEQHSVREFVELAAKELGINIRWSGSGVNEVGIIDSINRKSSIMNRGSTSVQDSRLSGSPPQLPPGQVIVRVDPNYFRPTEVDVLQGDASKATKNLGWEPRIGFYQLVSEMVASDFEEAERDYFCEIEGYKTFNYHE